MEHLHRMRIMSSFLGICALVVCFQQLVVNVIPLFAASGPITSAAISDQSQLGSNGWYVTGVTVLLTATSAVGVKSITFWLDAGSPLTVNADTTSQTFSQNGSHTLYFYAIDNNGVQESPTKSVSFKIDTISPVGWTNITETRNGNDHTFTFSATVTDATAGLDPTKAYMQYDVDDTGQNWGYYSDLSSCNSQWNTNQWYQLPTQSFSAGATSGTISTPAVNYCSSSGAGCDFMKVRVFDMAGNYSDRKICLGTPWLQTQNGDVYSASSISMYADAPAANASGIVSTAGTITSFATSTNQTLQNYPSDTSLSSVDYNTYYPTVSSQAQSLPSGKLPTASGYYNVSGNLSITSTIFPSGYSTAKNFATVIFVPGNLTVNTNVTTDPTSALVFIVGGNVNVDRSVTNINAVLISDGYFNSSYNGNNSAQLVINGMLYALGGFQFVRTLGTQTNKTTPAEVINYQPNIVTNANLQKLFAGQAQYTWQEVAP